MLKKLSTISILVACSTVYAAGTGETPPAALAATPPAAVAPAPEPAKPAAVAPAPEPAKPAAVAPAPEPAKPAAAPAVDLSGKWSSNDYDDIVIEQTGKKITGTYQYKDDDDVTQEGKFEGVIEGNTIKAKWFERPKVGKGEESRGDLEWKITDDGKMLAGWYRSEGEKDKEDFNLKR
ncbi:MAG: hypothetical protein QG599_508 [Pseudomonadota bacterium]|nr:hypothetical protein [Pseudomonadota bacterium]